MHIAPHPDDAGKPVGAEGVRYLLHRENQEPFPVQAMPGTGRTLFSKAPEGAEKHETFLKTQHSTSAEYFGQGREQRYDVAPLMPEVKGRAHVGDAMTQALSQSLRQHLMAHLDHARKPAVDPMANVARDNLSMAELAASAERGMVKITGHKPNSPESSDGFRTFVDSRTFKALSSPGPTTAEPRAKPRMP